LSGRTRSLPAIPREKKEGIKWNGDVSWEGNSTWPEHRIELPISPASNNSNKKMKLWKKVTRKKAFGSGRQRRGSEIYLRGTETVGGE